MFQPNPSQESHRWQPLDRSIPSYNVSHQPLSSIPPVSTGASFNSTLKLLNQPPPNIPPAATGGSFNSSLKRLNPTPLKNPTGGNRWIVQFQPRMFEPNPSQESHRWQPVDCSIPA